MYLLLSNSRIICVQKLAEMTRLCLIFCVVLTFAIIAQNKGKVEEGNLAAKFSSSRLVESPDARAKRRKIKKEKKRKRRMRKEKKEQKKGNEQKKGKEQRTRKPHRAVSDSCFEQVVTIMKMWKDVISNFEKQKKRMEKQNGTGSNKKGKKGAFAGVYQKLASAGGGDKTNLSCAGSSDSEGAAQLNNLTSSLAACQADIKSACDPASWPQPNMSKVF